MKAQFRKPIIRSRENRKFKSIAYQKSVWTNCRKLRQLTSVLLSRGNLYNTACSNIVTERRSEIKKCVPYWWNQLLLSYFLSKHQHREAIIYSSTPIPTDSSFTWIKIGREINFFNNHSAMTWVDINLNIERVNLVFNVHRQLSSRQLSLQTVELPIFELPKFKPSM
jgi:hypothetical protein